MLLDAWDVFVIISLIYTALALPVEVAFYVGKIPPALTFIDSFVFWVFVLDIFVTFQVAFSAPRAGTRELYEKAPIKIAKHYMAIPHGWFWMDIVTVLPLEKLGNLKSIRVIRILRLVRMMRLTRMMKLAARWHSRLGLSYAVVSIVKCLVVTSYCVHWITCVWGFLAIEGRLQEAGTWLTHYAKQIGEDEHSFATWDIYTISMYFCSATLTSVGFGDVVPTNIKEISLCAFTIFLTGFLWSGVLANIVNIVSNLDSYTIHFQKVSDDLNTLMEVRGLPRQLRMRARKHLHESFQVQRQKFHQDTIRALSPGLQGEIAIESGAADVCNCVPYLHNLDSDVLREIVNYIMPEMYSPGEFVIDKDAVSVIRRGSAWWKHKILSHGNIIGEDMLLDSAHLRDCVFPKTLTYVELMTLNRMDLGTVCEKFAHFSRRIRLAQIKLATRRGILFYAKRMKTMMAVRNIERLADSNEAECKEMHRLTIQSINDSVHQPQFCVTDHKLFSISSCPEKVENALIGSPITPQIGNETQAASSNPSWVFRGRPREQQQEQQQQPQEQSQQQSQLCATLQALLQRWETSVLEVLRRLEHRQEEVLDRFAEVLTEKGMLQEHHQQESNGRLVAASTVAPSEASSLDLLDPTMRRMGHVPPSSSASSFMRHDEALHSRESAWNALFSEAQGELLSTSPKNAAESIRRTLPQLLPTSHGNAAESSCGRTLLQPRSSLPSSADMPQLRPEVLQQFGHCLEALSQDVGRHHASVEATLSAQGRKLDALDSKLASLGPSAWGDGPNTSLMPPPPGSASAARWDLFATAPAHNVGQQPRVAQDMFSSTPIQLLGSRNSGTEELLSSGPARTAAKLLLELQSGRVNAFREEFPTQSAERRTGFTGDVVIGCESASPVNGTATIQRSMSSTDALRPSSVDSMIKTLESNLQQQRQQQQQQRNQQQLDAQHLQQRLQPLFRQEEHHIQLQTLHQGLLGRLSTDGNSQQQQHQPLFPVGLGSARRRSSSVGMSAPP